MSNIEFWAHIDSLSFWAGMVASMIIGIFVSIINYITERAFYWMRKRKAADKAGADNA